MSKQEKRFSLANIEISTKFIVSIIAIVSILLFFGNTVLLKVVDSDISKLLDTSKQSVNKLLEQQSKTQKKNLEDNINRLVTILQRVGVSSIAEFELSALNTYAAMAQKDPSVQYVAFKSKDGKTLASKGTLVSGSNYRTINVDVTSEGSLIGKLELIYDFNVLDKAKAELHKVQTKNIALLNKSKDDSLSHATLISMSGTAIVGLVLAIAIALLFKVLVNRRLSLLEENLKNVAEGDGDLTQRLNADSNDIIGRIARYYNSFVSRIHSTVSEIISANEELKQSAEIIRNSTDDARLNVNTQNSEIDQAATAINEMTATISEVARNASTAASAAQNADDQSQQGLQIVRNTITSITGLAQEVDNASEVINKLEKDSESISVILDVIRGIAEQTNLLALNAAIEAARAGEQGRGFAVVADEVRTLASRTQESTEEIHSMIELLQQGTADAVKVMQDGQKQAQVSVESASEAGNSLDTIAKSVATITEMNTQIASAAEEQNAVANEINFNITRVRDIASRSQEGIEQSANSSLSMDALAKNLSLILNKFKV